MAKKRVRTQPPPTPPPMPIPTPPQPPSSPPQPPPMPIPTPPQPPSSPPQPPQSSKSDDMDQPLCRYFMSVIGSCTRFSLMHYNAEEHIRAYTTELNIHDPASKKSAICSWLAWVHELD